MAGTVVKTINDFYRHADKEKARNIEEGLLLSDRQRSILDMFYHRKFGVTDIAERLCTSQWTVYRELGSIRSKLSAKMSEP